MNHITVCVNSFVLRTKNQDRRIYAGHMLYVGIRRDWGKGSKLFFVERVSGDAAIIGQGILEKILELDAMTENERSFCIYNNWYGRMIFERVERFLPPLPVRDTPLASIKPALLHGHVVPKEQAARIGDLVASRIIS